MGARANTAWRLVYAGKKSLWALSHCGPVDYALDKVYFAAGEAVLVALDVKTGREQSVEVIHPKGEMNDTLDFMLRARFLPRQ
jgi:outer membrane protein assembly factor BamB